MKKVISIILSVVMLLSVSVASVNAFALVGSQESTTKSNKITTEVNGKTSTDVTYEKDPTDPRKITFTYTGDGDLIGWEFPGMTEGVDYTVVKEKGNSITILLADDYDGEVIANAIVKQRSTTPTTKKNEKEKSPDTGAVAAAGVAAMGAGAAILAALKKKEDAE